MAPARTSIHGQWSSRWIFILAATGSAVGLGNIWRFPYITGENGGGAFVIVYLLCVACVGLPIMMAEILLGRRGRQSPIHSLESLAAEESRNPAWKHVGTMGVLAGFVILSFYSVIAGWSLAYVFRIGGGFFEGMTVDEIGSNFEQFIADSESVLAWHTIFMAMTVIVVSRGVRNGLENAVKWLMPALFALLLVMVGYSMQTDQFARTIDYLFTPDFSALTPGAVLAALGQAFFSLSLGMGAILTYGSYLPERASIPRTAAVIAIADTSVALLAGLAVFPIVFAYGLPPSSGPGLVFVTLSTAFAHMEGGVVFGCLFFILLTVAAWTSAISLLEPVTAWLVERKHWARWHACFWTGGITWALGVGALLSFQPDPWTMLGKTFFDWMEFLSTYVMLPLGGALLAIFAGWVLRRTSTVDELGVGDTPIYRAWLFLVRYVAPAGVFAVFLQTTWENFLKGLLGTG